MGDVTCVSPRQALFAWLLSSTRSQIAASAPFRQICDANRLPDNGPALAVCKNRPCPPLSLIALQSPAGRRLPWSRPCTIGGPFTKPGLIHHTDRGGQYLSVRHTERVAEAGIGPSVGSVDDSYDTARAETIESLCKTEWIHRRGPWRTMQDLERTIFGRVDWFDNRPLPWSVRTIPQAGAEKNVNTPRDVLDMAA